MRSRQFKISWFKQIELCEVLRSCHRCIVLRLYCFLKFFIKNIFFLFLNEFIIIKLILIQTIFLLLICIIYKLFWQLLNLVPAFILQLRFFKIYFLYLIKLAQKFVIVMMIAVEHILFYLQIFSGPFLTIIWVILFLFQRRLSNSAIYISTLTLKISILMSDLVLVSIFYMVGPRLLFLLETNYIHFFIWYFVVCFRDSILNDDKIFTTGLKNNLIIIV